MAGTKTEVSCRELFNKYNILPLSIKYLISILSLFCRQQRKIAKMFKCTQHTYKIDLALMFL